MNNDKSAFAEQLDNMGCNFPNGFCYRVFEVDPISGTATVTPSFINALNAFGFNVELPEPGQDSRVSDIFRGHRKTFSI